MRASIFAAPHVLKDNDRAQMQQAFYTKDIDISRSVQALNSLGLLEVHVMGSLPYQEACSLDAFNDASKKFHSVRLHHGQSPAELVQSDQ